MIAHIDVDAFFASVLVRSDPSLQGKPLLALGMGGGCVIAASYEAKAKGVKTGMRLNDALKLVPDAFAMPSDFRATYDATKQIFALLQKFCPGGVEEASPDEGYLDLQCLRHAERNELMLPHEQVKSKHVATEVSVSETLRGASTPFVPPLGGAHSAQHDVLKNFAHTLQSESDRFLDLPISIGIAPTKTLAKMGSKHRKPKGICIIEEKDREAFLGEKDISSIPGIGWKSTPKMKKLGFLTAFDFAHADPLIIEKVLGKTGLELPRENRGEAIYKVITNPTPPKSISRCRSFRGTNDRNFLYSQVMTHLQRCSSKLRRHELECARIGIWFRGADYKSGASAERSIGRYVAEESLLMPSVREMFEELIRTPTRTRTPYTQAGLVLSDFRPKGARQISLFEEPGSHQEILALQTALDDLRKKYGTESVRYGGAVANRGA